MHFPIRRSLPARPEPDNTFWTASTLVSLCRLAGCRETKGTKFDESEAGMSKGWTTMENRKKTQLRKRRMFFF